MQENQITSRIMMVRPAAFGYNAETAQNNAFQSAPDVDSPEEITRRAQQEFDVFVEKLRHEGVQVLVVEDTTDPPKPDAVFPNNWITTHGNGTIVTYPMYAKSRRKERREDIVEMLGEEFEVDHRINMEVSESESKFLEGTGSMILDRPNRIVYACRSERTSTELLSDFSRKLGYQMELFDALDANSQPIYHTNVMMALGKDLVVICLDAVAKPEERARLLHRFEQTEKTVISISLAQMESFAGNMLQVEGKGGKPIMVMSEQAFQSLRSNQIEMIRNKSEILHSPLQTIETFGGGSARCMMAEIFLPDRS